MIAARPFQDLTRGFGRNALDLPVAVLAGVAVAFVAFAMPGDLLTGLVSASGLPSLLAAAEPPLGLKARAGVGLAGALAAFVLVFALLRLLDRSGFEKPRPEAAPPPEEADLPRLRRRDVHPDAPVRRPISAARDLGEPAPPPEPVKAAVTPVWLAEAQPEPEPAPPPEPIEAAATPVWVAEAQPEPAPAVEASLDDLMARLAQGLARRRTRQAFTPQPQPPAPAPQVFPEAGDARLQNAIESLQRLAARGN
jgi:hypothetical protein